MLPLVWLLVMGNMIPEALYFNGVPILELRLIPKLPHLPLLAIKLHLHIIMQED